jgi:hypothetical protein
MNARRQFARGRPARLLVTLVAAWEGKPYPVDLPNPVANDPSRKSTLVGQRPDML